jgi:transposase
MSKPKAKCLTLQERVKVIELNKNGKSARKIAEELGVGKTQIQNIIKRKAEVLEDYESNMNSEMKRKARKIGNEDVNELTLHWVKEANSRLINITGPMMQEKALKIAKELGNTEFKASTGWLRAFLQRNNMHSTKQQGESGEVNVQDVEDWKKKLCNLCSDYEPRNIFNMDETGLFFRGMNRQTFGFEGEECQGGKFSKERITIGLCASMTGEKVKPIVIGKCIKPRCFKGLDSKTLPVHYYANKKAWMTAGIMESWLKCLDKK